MIYFLWDCLMFCRHFGR